MKLTCPLPGLHRLYKSLGDYDVLHGIFKSSHVGTQGITREALEAEERVDYMEALRLYKDVRMLVTSHPHFMDKPPSCPIVILVFHCTYFHDDCMSWCHCRPSAVTTGLRAPPRRWKRTSGTTPFLP